MKIKLKIEKEYEVARLKVSAGARYWEDSEVNGVPDEGGNLIPFRNGDYWCPVIDIETGVIVDWPTGTRAEIHYKVCDDGTYTLVDNTGQEICKYPGHYVPDCLCPKEEGYGDYIIMDIDENGKIDGWEFDPSDFTGEEE